mmetsp:Transcript_17435/g.36525  ORF Transcript_17435/g.36525 Transcript_17435/m.36525 type:complete len:544 (-) Transcript_17435:39-1670(-)
MSMISRMRSTLLTTTLYFVNLRASTSRTWMDCIDPESLKEDGMPRVYPKEGTDDVQYSGPMISRNEEISIHGTSASLFEEVDPFRFTDSPSVAPSLPPSDYPTVLPSISPSDFPSVSPTMSMEPTRPPTKQPTRSPTTSPTFSVPNEPRNPEEGYFNYDDKSDYGPHQWHKVVSDGDFWHTFDLKDSGSNQCDDNKDQSPIDVCVHPRGNCKETHEMRPKSGDYRMNGEFMMKQILPNKLRIVMAPRTGEEPDPPMVDFSSNGRGITDMTNIDIKIPSEHTVCGRRFDAEMQYFTYHPGRHKFVAVSFFLEASPTNPRNEHLQKMIDAFRREYNRDKKKCEEKMKMMSSAAHSFASGGTNRMLEDNSTLYEGFFQDDDWHEYATEESTINSISEEYNQSSSIQRELSMKWHPFHPDIQKTVHFWGYDGSFTEPPCTSDSVSWKIMDVPTPISEFQLLQFKQILFNHVDENCRRTSVHNSDGSVARPTQKSTKYYKCTRDNYVSDEERTICGDRGCNPPFGEGLNPYYPPLVDVTGPPTRSPSN